MRNDEHKMVAYARLAAVSQTKQQLASRNRFLILTGAAATRAGWPDVAQECRRLVLTHNPRHLIGKWDTFADALRSEEFPPFLKQLERTCGPELADHLLETLSTDPTVPPLPHEEEDLGAAVVAMWSDSATGSK